MTINFNAREEMVIHQLAVTEDISDENVIRQALRLYQMYRLGHIAIKWPPVAINITDFKVLEDPVQLSFNFEE